FCRKSDGGHRFAQFGGMGGDIFLKFLDEECVNDIRRVVRNVLRKSLVEQERVTSGAMLRIGSGRHIGASLRMRRWTERSNDCKRRDGRSGCCLRDICFCCRRAESRRLRGSARAMAISAIKLDGPVRTGEIRFHVDCMIDLDGAGVRESWAKCGEFGVPSFKARDAGCEIGRRVTCLEMGMALRTACVRRSRKLDSPTMLDVAGRAGGSENLILVMNGSIMA